MNRKKMLSLLLAITLVFSMLAVPGVSAAGAQQAAAQNIGDVTGQEEDGNVLIFQCGGQEVHVELCTARTARVHGQKRGELPGVEEHPRGSDCK